jgi:hypothetical protein
MVTFTPDLAGKRLRLSLTEGKRLSWPGGGTGPRSESMPDFGFQERSWLARTAGR